MRYHTDVWPGVLERIADCGIRNYSIFLRSGVLFAYFEYHGTDYEADIRGNFSPPSARVLFDEKKCFSCCICITPWTTQPTVHRTAAAGAGLGAARLGNA
ncbi:L-rhamnose mutarotase [Granulicella mallensis]|uniref:L-rhamnose mutarotase n=1 Tax=Granulicella mallensis TaxID=940614 RepID=UPI0028899878|nr:L-rhamnose mutarotase [Granulicella mallensis]